MSRVCEICGKHTTAGRHYTHRGRAKHLGGVGIKTTSKTKRTFRPNLRRVRALINGGTRRIRVCADCIKQGKVVKPI